MNFDFWVDKSNINKSDERNSESNENIIVDAFTLNAVSPSTINSKLKPYINNEDFETHRNKFSQNSWKANAELIANFSRKRSYDNPYEKKEINYDKTKIASISEK